MTQPQAAAEVSWTAFQAMKASERELFIGKLMRDKILSEVLRYAAVIENRKNEPSVSLDDYLSKRSTKKVRIYRIVLTKPAIKELSGLPNKTHDKVVEHLRELEENPRVSGSEKLTAINAYKLRVGKFWIVYEINEPAKGRHGR